MSISEPARSLYFDALCDAMAMLAKAPKAVFMGQATAAGGIQMSASLVKVPKAKLLEFPVAEDMQMGAAIGMSLEGMLPVCIYPRWNFLLLAANQLVNHLDRLPIYSGGGYRPKVIIRVAAPATEPFHCGPQHDDDFSLAFALMLRTVHLVRLKKTEQIIPAYRDAMEYNGSTLLVEYSELYRPPAAEKVAA